MGERVVNTKVKSSSDSISVRRKPDKNCSGDIRIVGLFYGSETFI